MPKDLVEQRAKLPEDARAAYDQRYQKIVNGNPERVENFRAAMAKLEQRNGGDLAKGLTDTPAKPELTGAHGEGAVELPRVETEIDQFLSDLDEFVKTNPGAKSIAGLRKGQISELKRLQRMRSGEIEATPERIEGLENNLKGRKAELDAARTAQQGTQFGQYRGGQEIDQITPHETEWINIKNMRPFDASDGRLQEIIEQARRNLQEAERVTAPTGSGHPEVVFDFSQGVTPDVRAALEAVEVNGRHPIVRGPTVSRD